MAKKHEVMVDTGRCIGCGLGVLFSGFYTMCANRGRKLRSLMQMEKGEKAVTTLVMGYPGVKYHRTARREAAKLRKL